MTGPEEGRGGGGKFLGKHAGDRARGRKGGGGGKFLGNHPGDWARGRKGGQFLGKHAGDWTIGKTGVDRKVIKMQLPTMDSG